MTTVDRITGSSEPHRQRARGLTVTALGLLIISPDSLAIRLISVDVWTLLAWRGLLTSIGLTGILWWRHRGAVLARFRDLGWRGVAVALLAACSNILYVVAITHTSVSNTLVILAGAPLATGLLALVFLDERLPLRSWVAVGFVVAGVVVLVDPGSGSTQWGDLAAVGSMLALSGSLTMLRGVKAHDGTPAMAASQLLVALVAMPLATHTALSAGDAALIVGSGLVMIPAATALFIAGPRYLPAAEVGLLLPLETLLGSLWVWLALGEAPAPMTLIGGSIILGTLAIHSAASIRANPLLRPAQ